MFSPSVLNKIEVPRLSRICLLVRRIIMWRLPDWVYTTLPVPVILKRFLAPDLVFSLGIWLSFGLDALFRLAAQGDMPQATRAKRTATAALTSRAVLANAALIGERGPARKARMPARFQWGE